MLTIQYRQYAAFPITGANLSFGVDDNSSLPQFRQFYGLGLSSSAKTYLDGDAKLNSNWWHAVGSNTKHNGGIPAHNCECLSLYFDPFCIMNLLFVSQHD